MQISCNNGIIGATSPINVLEAVEKVSKKILGQDEEKSYLLKCATINDLMLGEGQVTPENIVLTRQKGFFYRLVIRADVVPRGQGSER